MRTVREVMTSDLITIHPASTVRTAVMLMKGHNIGALPVVNEEALLGLLETQHVLGCDPGQRVSDIMSRDFTSISPDTPVQKAADAMAKAGASCLIAEEEGRLIGILTHSDIIPELGRAYDPLTGLPWYDTLREWAIQALSQGQEISILFFDLDNFGSFNKKYGHVTGDAVLKALSGVFLANEHSGIDVLCRMGGDEFAIGSVRQHQAAIELAARVQLQVEELDVDGIEEPLRVSFGVSGGRRTKEREETHYAATVDDLLNRASRECMQMKANRSKQQPPAAVSVPAPVERPRIERISYTSTDSETLVSVRLSRSGEEFEGSSQGDFGARPSIELAAEACAEAVRQMISEEYRLALEDVTQMQLRNKETALLSTVVLASPRESVPHYGVAVVRNGNVHRAAAACVLSALNRVLARLEASSKS